VAEDPSSEPTAKNYSLREELAQHREILRWFCGRFEQADTGESCGVAWRREWDSNPRYGFPHTRFPSVRLKPLGHLSEEASHEGARGLLQVTAGDIRGHFHNILKLLYNSRSRRPASIAVNPKPPRFDF
jgi:hypothetical protein